MKNLVVLISIVISIFSSVTYAADPARDPFYTEGIQKYAPPINTVHEQVDPFSGILTLSHTDLHLPGNGGLDVNLVRTYNSMIWGRRDVSFPGLVAKNEKSPLGIGWTMHMGIVHNPMGAGSSNRYLPDNPVIEMPDGSKHTFYKDKNDSTRFISKEFWVYKLVSGSSSSGTWELTLTDGTIYTFEYGTANAGYNITDDFNNVIDKIGQVTRIRNAANTASINIGYYKYTNGLSYMRTITDSASRTINLNYDYANNKLTSITVDSRTLSYGYTTINGNNYLTSFTPPVGNAWSYGYETAADTYELNSITYPTGGRIAYSYNNTAFATGVASATVQFRVVTGRTTYKRDGVQDGTWSYTYSAPTTGDNVTTISAPGVSETYRFYGWGNTGTNNVWKVGLPISKSYSGAFSLTESYLWTQGTVISNDQISNANWNGTIGQVYDLAINVPFMSGKSITRDGQTYSTTYSSFNTYGDPQTISETGDASRSRSITYWTNTTKNIVKGKPATESVIGTFTGTANTSWTYDSTSGNLTQVTNDGVTTNYGYDTSGNLSSLTDANNHALTYLWSNGRMSRETNDYYNVSRVINANGTIASETNGRGTGYTTSFGYDGNLRLTRKTPPAGNAISISYPADSSYRRETRGSYSIDYTFDGFGRPTGSSDSRGITTTIAYTAYGNKDYEDSSVGDKVYYDYFGRVRQILHKDTSSINYAYSNSNVTITDETTTGTQTLTYNAFGNPDEKFLMGIRDQATNSTTYTRNIQGNIIGITQGSITRSFGYDTTKKSFLNSETNPETGTISYGRDNVGNMIAKIDASGTTNYGYDNIDRLTSITAGTSSISFGYDNANNRTSMTYPGGSAVYTFDAANRMTQKAETISGRSYTTTYGYDGNDNITTVGYPSGRSITYGVNGNNQVTSVTGFGGSVTSVNYSTAGNTAGLPTSYTLSNGVTTTLGYNSRNLTTSINAGSVLNVGYGHDTRGNTTSYTNSFYTSQSFGYDSLSRLTSFSGSWGSGSFGYDAAGNRTSKIVSGSSTSYGYSNNRVTSATGGEPATYTYSGEGLLNGGTWQNANYTLTYDSFDNLASYKSGSTVLASFVYDADGQRVSKTSNNSTAIYHYNQQGQVLSENEVNGNPLVDYVYFNGKIVAKAIATPAISVSPTSDSFGNVYNNTTSPSHTFTVRNAGTANLVLGSIGTTGTDYAEFYKTNDGCSGRTLTANTTCTFQIAFMPSSAGAKSAAVTIPSNDPGVPSYNAPINGIGVLPTLNIGKTGTGNGTITSSPAGISCGGSCSASYGTGTTVVLSASPDSNSSFTGWTGGGCIGTGTCSVTLTADTPVAATFTTLPPIANFSARPTTVSGPFVVNFVDQSQRATSWQWDFGDGTNSNAQNPSHTYAARGKYSVNLTVTNGSGSSSVSKTVTDYIDITPILNLLLD